MGSANALQYASVLLPATQPTNFEPCLKDASHSRRKSVSVTPICFNVERIVGHVPSPTPIGGCVRDSIRVTDMPFGPRWGKRAARTPAVIHPAVPPPTTTIRRMGSARDTADQPVLARDEARHVCQGGHLEIHPLEVLAVAQVHQLFGSQSLERRRGDPV